MSETELADATDETTEDDHGSQAVQLREEAPASGPIVKQVDLFRNRVRGGRGTLIIDNRASGGEYLEVQTLTCAHCNCIVALNSKRVRPRNFCFRCNAYVCDDKKCCEECNSMERCLELVAKDPTIPALPRAKDGSLLFDRALLEQGRPF